VQTVDLAGLQTVKFGEGAYLSEGRAQRWIRGRNISATHPGGRVCGCASSELVCMHGVTCSYEDSTIIG
jgi:hypothetical protein